MSTMTKTEVDFLARKALDVLDPLEHYEGQCHGASIAVVNAEVYEKARVARGTCDGVGAQHSWIVLGDDCYDREAEIIDPTLWGYRADVDGIWVGTMEDGMHRPHGAHSIFDWGRPEAAKEEPVELKPRTPFSDSAKLFLDMLGPLDVQGWRILCNAPVEDWPAAEIFDAILETFDWGAALIPIDVQGMLTDRNPGGLYLPGDERE